MVRCGEELEIGVGLAYRMETNNKNEKRKVYFKRKMSLSINVILNAVIYLSIGCYNRFIAGEERNETQRNGTKSDMENKNNNFFMIFSFNSF